MENDFKKINFGNSDALTEKTYNSKLLLDGFLDEGYVNKIMNDRHFLVYGQKGSGKTAISCRIELIAKDSINVKTYSFKEFDYRMFNGLGNHKDEKRVRSKNSWEFVLLNALFAIIQSENNSENFWDSTLAEKIDYFKNALHPSRNDNLNTLVEKVTKKNVTFDLKVYKKTTDIEYDSIPKELKKIVSDAKLSRKQFLIIDDLDDILSEKENQNLILSELVHTIYNLNIEFYTNEIPIKIILLCRRDILDNLSYPNKQKVIDDYSIELVWYEKNIKNYENISLIKLLNQRAKVSLDRDVDIFKIFLPPYVGAKKTYKFIFDFTRHIPRDLIRLMNEIKEVYVPNMNLNDFNKAIDEYSANYFYGEIKDELSGMIGSDQINSIFKILMDLDNYKTSAVMIKEKAKEITLNVDNPKSDDYFDVDKILILLYNTGVIGNIDQKEYHFRYRERWTEFNPKQEIIIHYALQNILRLRTGNTMNKFDYDLDL